MPSETEVKIETMHWSLVARNLGVLLIGVAMMCLMFWMVFSTQQTKLYEADNVVCASQPLALNCFERKAR